MSEPQGCVIGENVVVCYGRRWVYREMRKCDTCGGVKRHVVSLEGWYGWNRTCCGCGRQWDSEHGYDTRKGKGLLADRRDRARRRWAEAMPKAEAEAAEYRYLFGDMDAESALVGPA